MAKAEIGDKFHAACALLSLIRNDRDFVPSVTKTAIRSAAKELQKYADFDGCSSDDIPEIIELAGLIALLQFETVREATYRTEAFSAAAHKALLRYQSGTRGARGRGRVTIREIEVPDKPVADLISSAVARHKARMKGEGTTE